MGTLVLLPDGAIYARTPKHYWIVSVQENYLDILAHLEKNGKDCLLAARMCIPGSKGVR